MIRATQDILGQPNGLQSTLGFQVDSNPIDHFGVLGGRLLIDQVRLGLRDI